MVWIYRTPSFQAEQQDQSGWFDTENPSVTLPEPPRGAITSTPPTGGGEGNSNIIGAHDPYANGYAIRNGQRIWDAEKPLTPQEQALIDILTPTDFGMRIAD